MLNFLKSRILYHPDLSRSLLHFNIELDIDIGLDSAGRIWAMLGWWVGCERGLGREYVHASEFGVVLTVVGHRGSF
jgi:hypothetical protein